MKTPNANTIAASAYQNKTVFRLGRTTRDSMCRLYRNRAGLLRRRVVPEDQLLVRAAEADFLQVVFAAVTEAAHGGAAEFVARGFYPYGRVNGGLLVAYGDLLAVQLELVIASLQFPAVDDCRFVQSD